MIFKAAGSPKPSHGTINPSRHLALGDVLLAIEDNGAQDLCAVRVDVPRDAGVRAVMARPHLVLHHSFPLHVLL